VFTDTYAVETYADLLQQFLECSNWKKRHAELWSLSLTTQPESSQIC